MGLSKISNISRSLIDVIWFFGPKGGDDACCSDLSLPEFLALETIADRTDCSVKSVGEILRFTKSGATRIVNRLERRGYLEKMRSAEDARICCIAATAAGLQVLKEADEKYLSQFENLLSEMPGELAMETRNAILRMANIINR